MKRLTWVPLLVLFFATTLLAENDSDRDKEKENKFNISSAGLSPLPEDALQTNLIARLKHQAVLDRLSALLETRFPVYQAQFTPDFTERFITDYKVNKNQDGSIALSGHVDMAGLRDWVRFNETKSVGATLLKTGFIFSAQLPGFNFAPGETSARTASTPIAQFFYQTISSSLQKFNAKLSLYPEKSTPLAQPAKRDNEVRALRDASLRTGFNTLVWTHLTMCPGCGIRAEIAFYNLSQGRLVLLKADNFPLLPSEILQPDKIKSTSEIKDLVKSFTADFDDQVSKGILFSAPIRLAIEGLSSPQSYRKIDTALARIPSVFRISPLRIEWDTLEYELFSNRDTKALGNIFSDLDLGDGGLKLVRIDPQTVVMRYFKRKP